MLFNSVDFALFLPTVFVLYWFVSNRNLRFQNAVLVAASYVFYGWWDWRFLSLILFSTIVDYSVGLGLAREQNINKRKLLLWTSIVVNLGLLGFFKYFDFFLENFVAAFSFFGKEFEANTLGLILPVGISFYTFQTLSYTIDVYERRLKPTRDFIAFAAFVSFFAQLVAGPIERATNLLPQFNRRRSFDYDKAVDGSRQILWGLFKKMVVADNCGRHANAIFNNSSEYSGSTLALGAFFFAFQIYGDFSGYSDIAIGTGRLFGIDLRRNFAFPYFSRDIAEFWRRWHISLSTWFRDYLYIPLGGSRGGVLARIRNTFIVFMVSGFWHGANWTFVIWGALNAVYLLPLLLLGKNREHMEIVAARRIFPTIREALGIVTTFILTLIAWIFFRASDLGHALDILSEIFSDSLLTAPQFKGMESSNVTIVLILFLVVVEWFGREQQFAIARLGVGAIRPVRWAFYSLIIFTIAMFMQTNETPFIYFQF